MKKSIDTGSLFRTSLALGALAVVGCASGDSNNNAGGAGGTTDVATTGISTSSSSVSTTASTTTVASSSASGGCAQDCSEVPVPDCYESVCNQTTHACEVKPQADGSDCEDGLFCTDHDTCQDGVCEPGDPLVCAPMGTDPCQEMACDEDADMCTGSPAPNGTMCTSTDLCTDNAICQNGHCLGAPKDCSALPLPDDCHVAGACDPATGDCLLSDAPDGTTCLSGDACEANKTCTAGVCSGTPIIGCNICSEVEVNNDVATANDDATCTSWGGVIGVVGDKDFYQVDVTVAGSRVQAEVRDTAPNTCPVGFDSVIRLWDSTGVQIATDDDGGANNCSLMSATTTGASNLAVGTYFLSVEEFGNNATSPPYVLDLAVLPPGCGNGVLEGTEACDGAALNGQNCVSQGFGSGTLTCDATCNFDTSGCLAPACGDALVQPGEDCDGANLNGQTCVSQGFGSGTLSCDAACNFNTAACNPPACGDGIVQPGEECDDGNTSNTDGCDTSCLVPACAVGQTRISIGSTAVPIAITDNHSFTDVIHISQSGTIMSLYLMFDATHTFDGDIDLSLAGPGVTLPGLDITSDNGSLDDNYTSTVFGSTATTSITSGTAPFTGLFLPEQAFTPLIGTSVTGDWSLTLADDAGGDIGTLNQWRIIACVQ